MLSASARDVIATLRADRDKPRPPVEQRRAEWEAGAAAAPLPDGTVVEPGSAGGVPVELVRCGETKADARILLLHGGGYVSGSCTTHREMAARLSSLSGLPVLVVDYRRAPEHPFPAATDDALSAYRHLVDNEGIEPARIAIIGDSAGGGLTAALLFQIRELGWAQPAAGVMLSPWLDLEILSPSAKTNAEADPSITHAGLTGCGRQYIAGADPKQPLASPLYGDPRGLPPLYINVGDLEILLDDARLFAEKAMHAGVEVTLKVAEGLWHVYPAWASTVPEAMEEIKAVAHFIRGRVG